MSSFDVRVQASCESVSFICDHLQLVAISEGMWAGLTAFAANGKENGSYDISGTYAWVTTGIHFLVPTNPET